ncbi:MAG: GntR family transcriptional regulator [Spirochaetes bacterium]|nr:GntR family transcriptional regulator [Spirochaetota bacterium]
MTRVGVQRVQGRVDIAAIFAIASIANMLIDPTTYEPVESAAIDSDPFLTAAERVYRTILRKIIQGEFLPGTRLPRRKLAELTGVSQIPVLEALKRLEQDGLVEYRPRCGCIVAVPTVHRILDMYALREAIECQVARILSLQITQEQTQQFLQHATHLDSILYSSEEEGYVSDLHYRFHIQLAEATGFESLVSLLRKANFLWLLWKGIHSKREHRVQSKESHAKLVKCISDGNPQNAEEAMRRHILEAKEPLLRDYNEPNV